MISGENGQNWSIFGFSTTPLHLGVELRLCKTRENSNFWKKGKIVISVKTRNFSKSQMTKRILSLELSHEI